MHTKRTLVDPGSLFVCYTFCGKGLRPKFFSCFFREACWEEEWVVVTTQQSTGVMFTVAIRATCSTPDPVPYSSIGAAKDTEELSLVADKMCSCGFVLAPHHRFFQPVQTGPKPEATATPASESTDKKPRGRGTMVCRACWKAPCQCDHLADNKLRVSRTVCG